MNLKVLPFVTFVSIHNLCGDVAKMIMVTSNEVPRFIKSWASVDILECFLYK